MRHSTDGDSARTVAGDSAAVPDDPRARLLPAPDPEEARAFRVAHPGIDQVDVLIADMAGILRGKKMPVSGLDKLYAEGIGFPGSIFATDITGETVEETGLGFEDGDADRPCLPIPRTLDPVPWFPRPKGQVLVQMRDRDGGPFFADPRTVLAGVVARLAERGLTPVVAVELEFYLMDLERRPDGSPQAPRSPVTGKRQTTTQVYGIEELDEFDALFHEIAEVCRIQDIPVESAVSEYAAGQYEINLDHIADALAACDDALLFKRVVRSVALKHGVDATFMSKPFPEQAGSGMHIHLSLLDRDGGNVFASDDPAGTPVLGHAIAGLMETMGESMAFFAQNQNAFRRFQPKSYVPHAPTWAVNNRSSALRVPAGPAKDRRVEHRVAGACSNPYLVLAAVLAGVDYGLERRLDPGPPITGNAYAQVEEELTSSWIVALDQLDRSDFLREYFGSRFVDVYVELKWAERDKFFSLITPAEYEWYMGKL